MRLRSLRLDQWRDRFGWIAGAFLIMASLAALLVELQPTTQPSFSCLAAAAAVGFVGALLFVPAAPRIARALIRLAAPSVPSGEAGPFPVRTFSLALPPTTGSAAPIPVQIWRPAASDAPSPSDGKPVACEAMREQPLAEVQAPYSIILYAPGGGGPRDDNASTSTFLANHGYVVVAIDDIDRDPPSPGADEAAPPLAFDFSSAEAFETTLARSADKVRRQAEKALAALDRLEACAGAYWPGRLRFDRIGFFGFSFGGATAAEAGTIDPRIAAVANLDGWLFGRALLGALDKPYLIMLSDIAIPGPRERQSSNPKARFEAKLTDCDLAEEARLANRQDGYGFLVRNSFHENFSDAVFGRRFFRTWFVTDPVRIKSIREAYLLAFFDVYVRGLARPLLRQTPPYRGVEAMHANQKWRDRIAAPARRFEGPAIEGGRQS